MSFISDNLTIVIPSKNEGKNIIPTLNSITNIYPDVKIVVADTFTDNTANIIELYFQSIKHKNNLIMKGGLPAIGRNNRFNFVKTPYVLFMDADITIDDVNLEKILTTMMRDDLHLGTAKITTKEFKYKIIHYCFDIVQWVISHKTPFAVGGFMLFNCEIFKGLGGFDNEDKFAEDYHLSSKISPNKFKVFDYRPITTPRRYKNKGVFYMVKLMIKCWFNKYNDDFYKKDYNYWE